MENLSWDVTRDGEGMRVEMVGSTDLVAEGTEQARWAGAALRRSPFGDSLAYCSSTVVAGGTPRASAIRFSSVPMEPPEGVDWPAIFCGATVACGFPILHRQDGKGLEMPLQVMAGIIGARLMTEFDGGLIVKGLGRAFVPVKRMGDGVQWQLIRGPDEEELEGQISYGEVASRCKDRALTEEVDMELAHSARAFIQ